MSLVISFIFCLAIIATVLATENVRMESKVNTFSSRNWIKIDNVENNDYKVTAVFMLKHNQQKVNSLANELLELASPNSPHYGRWKTMQQVKEHLSPSSTAVDTVLTYITSFEGISREDVIVSKLGDKVSVKLSIKTANTMFDTQFGVFHSAINPKKIIARITQPYYLPENVAAVVNLVDDIMRFPSVRQQPLLVNDDKNDPAGMDDEFNSCGSRCTGYTTPAVLQKAYSYEMMTDAAKGNSMSVAEFQFQYYDETDLQSFSDACSVTASVEEAIGGNNPDICTSGGCTESLLDIEYIEAVAHPVPLTVIYLSSYSLLDWIDQVLAMDSPPLVHSVSYGNDEVQQTSVEYMESVNTQFMMAGTMGLSILFASGDQGVWGRTGVGATFHPDFPAASPYVTAVGGTNFKIYGQIGEETVWNCGGGGFSDTFETPSWQADAVSDYIFNAKRYSVLPDEKLFNSTGRGYPDISALGGEVNPYCIAIRGGKFGGVAGTSASCPVAAGIFAQLNDVRLKAGKTSLGWLNPFIYSNGNCFNDVRDKSVNNCYKGSQGFAAIDGWDPATGFGTPNYSCLEKAVNKLP